MVKRILLAAAVFIIGPWPLHAQDNASGGERWTADLQVLRQHQTPEWLLDAKLGIQFVGPPRDFTDEEMFHWTRSAQRKRVFDSPTPDSHLRAHKDDLDGLGMPYVWTHDRYDIGAAMKAYEKTGARFLVSMLGAAFFGTEGLLMTPEEVREARKSGFKVGLHYNMRNMGRVPSIGDPGYVDWMHQHVKKAVRNIESSFLFFDGPHSTPEYFRSYELIAWYYNWADSAGKEVWVNDDLGHDHERYRNAGDVVDMEGFTTDGVAPRPWVNWDNLRNEWNCWVNQYGIHKRNGEQWTWQYKSTEDLLRVFINDVAKGGGWVVQMVNTEQAWEVMYEIGDWLSVNGEAIYGTRPWEKPNSRFERVPSSGGWGEAGLSPWWWRFQRVVEESTSNGPIYYTRKGSVLYAIHWGWPGESLLVPDIEAAEGASIQMMGVDEELSWKQQPEGVYIHTPDERPGEYAYAFKIPLAEAFQGKK